MHRNPMRMQTKKHQKNKSKKLRGWVLSQSLFVLSVFFFNYIILTDARHSQNTNTTHTLRTFHILYAAPDRNGCWLQSSVFVCTACAALRTSPSFDAQPTSLSSIAPQRNFGSRQTHGEKHRNPARGQRNFWLLFLPWKSNIISISLISS